MSGHSKWASIKHKKAKMDAQRGKLFSRLTREITVAASRGGGDREGNPRLRTAVEQAKDANMPADKIERAIKKGTGELPGTNYEEISYEGYGSGGVAIIVEAVTDNKNRTTSDVRRIFSKGGGRLSGAGSVAWMFKKKGVVTVELGGDLSEDELMEFSIEKGADDFNIDDGTFTISCSVEVFEAIKKGLVERGVKPTFAQIAQVPDNTVRVEGKEAEQVLHLMEALEECEDVQNVYANFDIPSEIMEKVR